MNMRRPPPISTLFPYTTLFRSDGCRHAHVEALHEAAHRHTDALRACGGEIGGDAVDLAAARSEEHTSELQSHSDLVCRPMLDKKTHPCWRFEQQLQPRRREDTA